MKKLLFGGALVFLLVISTLQQAHHLQKRPVELRLGAVASTILIKMLAGEYSSVIAFRNVVKVMFYFGAFFEDNPNRVNNIPEYANMYQHLNQAVKLDPYNMDAYYFAQSAFTWEVGRAREVNILLDHGMKYRTNDFLLPFYAGFNSAYFLKDYPQAAHYFKLASERSGNRLFATLAARYFHEAGQNQLGLNFLDSMIKGAKDLKERLIYEKRRDALLAIQTLEQAVDKYRAINGKTPTNLEVLSDNGLLDDFPVDPYGGSFYLDEKGRIRTTSKFALKATEPIESSNNSE